MTFPLHDSTTSILRRICDDIEEEFTSILAFNDATRKISDMISSSSHQDTIQSRCKQQKSSLPSSSSLASTQEKKLLKINKLFENIRNEMIKCISSKLPLIISYQEKNNDKMEDLKEDYLNLQIKYKQMFQNYQNKQLENDKIKMEIFSLSQSYENAVVAHEQLKFKYQQMKEAIKIAESKKDFPLSRGSDITPRVLEATIKKANKQVNTDANHNDSRQQSKIQNEVRQTEKEYYQITIRESQQQITSLKNDIAQLKEYIEALQEENRELDLVSAGEKNRSEKLDRQILDLLNINQEYKLQLLECKAEINKINEKYCESLNTMAYKQNIVEKLQEESAHLDQIKESLLRENKQLSIDLKDIQEQYEVAKSEITKYRKQNQDLHTKNNKVTNQIHNLLEEMKVKQLQHQQHLNELKNKYNANEQLIKSKNSERISQISQMHRQIKDKLEQKVSLMVKLNKEYKEKNKSLKNEIERLYQSLEMQVEKEYKYQARIKQLAEKNNEGSLAFNQLRDALTASQNTNGLLMKTVDQNQLQIILNQKKIKQLESLKHKLFKQAIPKLLSEITSLKLSKDHLLAMMKIEVEQLQFLTRKQCQSIKSIVLQSHHEKFNQNLIENSNLKSELEKWKESCKIYQAKYTELEECNHAMRQKISKLQNQAKFMREQIDKQKINQINTAKSMEVIRQKCKEVEASYKLIEDLSKQNYQLKSKLERDYFKYLPKPDLLNKQMNSTTQNICHPVHDYFNQKSNLTVGSTFQRSNLTHHHHCNEDEMATRSEIQRLRFQGIKRQYQMLHREG